MTFETLHSGDLVTVVCGDARRRPVTPGAKETP